MVILPSTLSSLRRRLKLPFSVECVLCAYFVVLVSVLDNRFERLQFAIFCVVSSLYGLFVVLFLFFWFFFFFFFLEPTFR